MNLGLAETEELAMLMAALEHDLSALIQREYDALLSCIFETLSGPPN
jgi:hypothetical protein